VSPTISEPEKAPLSAAVNRSGCCMASAIVAHALSGTWSSNAPACAPADGAKSGADRFASLSTAQQRTPSRQRLKRADIFRAEVSVERSRGKFRKQAPPTPPIIIAILAHGRGCCCAWRPETLV
jgi:hypothetical protein